ncbi:MAG: carbamoyl phosphate synthase small subunit [Eubacteriaceae bacterium]|nr:carbamoyl phosphate synthase small subunit [Eubacteriaceae bacterium]
MANDSMMAYRDNTRAWLILADGTIFEGWSLGAKGTTVGEVVFTTGMTGYQETLTDPSYYGQIVTQTFPLIGNYGLNQIDYESSRVWLSGYIIREWCYEPSNFRSKTDLGEYLERENIVGIYDIDTRALTKKIRETGVMNGAITTEYPEDMDAFMKTIKEFKIKDAVKNVSFPKPVSYTVDDPVAKVVLMDYGYKRNILRSLNQRGCDVIVMPQDSTAEDIKKLDPDGIMLSNGPGDPKDDREIISNLKEIIKTDIPILGICLGHQLMAIASGGQTEKLKYGHRGANQPVMDVAMDRVFVTSQNHGYAVVSDSITEDIGRVSHYNVNDGSCEGVEYKRPKTFTVQFHPEAAAGPQDTQYLFDRFIENMTGGDK